MSASDAQTTRGGEMSRDEGCKENKYETHKKRGGQSE
jgi:hypothetical protein